MQKESIEGYRLSPQQRHLWALQREGRAAELRVRCVVSITGEADLPLLRQALRTACQRQEILRTTFHCLPGMTVPLQVINEQSVLHFSEHDLRARAPDAHQAALAALLHEASRAAYDFTTGPLGHLSLALLSASQSVLIICISALCADAAGLRSLVRQVGKLYAASLGDAEPPAEPLQYADVAEWQNELFEAEEAEPGKEFWRKQPLADGCTLKLPLENEPAGDAPFAIATHTQAIKPELVAQIELCARSYQVPVADFLLAGWYALLARLTGQASIITGVTCSGRNYPELEETVGLLHKYLPVHTQAAGHARFTHLLTALHSAREEAEKWQECFAPEQYARADKTGDAAPCCRYGFDFAGVPPTSQAANVTFTITDEAAYADRFSLKIVCRQSGAELLTEFHYDRDAHAAADVQRLAEQYHTLLASAARQPERQLGELELLGVDECRQLVCEFNQTQTSYPHDRCAQHLFEAQAAQTPDSIAIVYGEQHVTYATLNARANQLAHYLRRRGVGPEVLVGICLERSVEMVTALLGILKAGGAYLPLELANPDERLAFMLQDAQAAAVVTIERLRPRLRAGADNAAQIVCLDREVEAILRESRANPRPDGPPQNLAYLIYTSGSTGRPKGVMISQRGLANYLSWCSRAYAVARGQGAPVHSPLGFDLTVTSLFAPLLQGRTVFLLPESEGLNALGTVFQHGGAYSLIKLTPAHLQLLAQLLPAQAAQQTAALVVGGEALFAEDLCFWRTNAPDIRIVNEYGPTEAVVGCCVYEVPPEFKSAGAVPIGHPIANAQLYVLDEHLRPVPYGVPGELYIGGACLARGYLNRPEQTAEKFIPHPFSASPGQRLYRTGDRARHLPLDGLEYLGRTDEQVKLRGYRIELAEIRALLKEHRAVQECVVLLREDTPGEQRLVAYVVCQRDAPPSTDELRDFLKAKLPDYMIPAAFIMLDEIPLTKNGKLARHALPAAAVVVAHTAPRRDFVAPRDETEAALALIWQETLQRPHICVTDKFLDLGGHSLLALRLLARINQHFNVHLSLAALLQAETIAELAQLLRPPTATAPACEWSPLVRLHQPQRDEGSGSASELPFFCVHPATGSAFAYVELAHHLRRRCYGLQARIAEPLTSIEEMARSYLTAIQAVQARGPYLLGGWSMGGLVAYEMAVQLQAAGAEVGLVVLLDRGAQPEEQRSEAALQELFAAVVGNIKAQLEASGDETWLDEAKYRQYYELFKSNYRACEKYCAPRYDGRVVLFLSEESRELSADETLGWGALAQQVEIYHVPGTHNAMTLEPNVRVLAALLNDCLAQTQTRFASGPQYPFDSDNASPLITEGAGRVARLES